MSRVFVLAVLLAGCVTPRPLSPDSLAEVNRDLRSGRHAYALERVSGATSRAYNVSVGLDEVTWTSGPERLDVHRVPTDEVARISRAPRRLAPLASAVLGGVLGLALAGRPDARCPACWDGPSPAAAGVTAGLAGGALWAITAPPGRVVVYEGPVSRYLDAPR